MLIENTSRRTEQQCFRRRCAASSRFLRRPAPLGEGRANGKGTSSPIEGWICSSRAVVDTALAGQNAAVAAESLGLGVCYVGGIRDEVAKVAEALRLPPRTFALFALTVGFPAKTSQVRHRLPMDVVVHYEVYSDEKLEDGLQRYDEMTAASGIYAERRGQSDDAKEPQLYGWCRAHGSPSGTSAPEAGSDASRPRTVRSGVLTKEPGFADSADTGLRLLGVGGLLRRIWGKERLFCEGGGAVTERARAIFVDLQGTLGGEGLGDVRNFDFYPFAPQAIKLINESPFLAAVTPRGMRSWSRNRR